MGVETTAQVDKKCYKNQTAGNLGVVKLDHLGGQVGANVEPFGTVYLSDDEARLTARAAKSAADSPFVEKSYLFLDEAGKHVHSKMRPLVLLADAPGEDASERYVPGLSEEPQDLNLKAKHDEVQAVLDGDDREAPSEGEDPVPGVQAGTGVHPSTLRGADGPTPGPSDEDEAATGSDLTGAPPQQPAPTSVASQPQNAGPTPSESAGVGDQAGSPSEQEEHAGVTPSGEETGAAQTPSGQAPEGEYAQHEEVGSPEAPAADDTVGP